MRGANSSASSIPVLLYFALPGARASGTFTLSMVLLVLVPISVVMIDARREAQDDATLRRQHPRLSARLHSP